MSTIIGDTGCPRCIENGNDKTKNHLILFEDGGAYCNRCKYATNWKEKELEYNERKELTDEEVTELVKDFESCSQSAWNERGLSISTIRRYGCKTGVHPSDKTKIGSFLIPIRTRVPDGGAELSGYKVGVPKEFRNENTPKYYCQGRVKDATLFGEELIPSAPFKKLFITESPMDAMALYQAIKDSQKGTKWEYLEPIVVGVQHGAGSAASVLAKIPDKLKLAEEIILVFDNDKAGQDAVAKVKGLIPNIRSVQMPKDCNDMLLDGKGKEMAKLCLWGSDLVKIDCLVDIGELADDITKKPTWGKPWPWATLTNLTYGIRSEVIGVAAGVGVGKTEFKYECIANDLISTDDVIGVFDLEATPGRTGKSIVGKLLNQLLYKPDAEYDEEEVRAKIEEISGRVKLYKHKGVKSWEEIRKAIRHMVVVDGCTKVYLDNVTALVADLSTAEANEVLNSIMGEVSGMTHELNFAFIYFAHLNQPKYGPSHERGGKVLPSQLTGSRAMIRWSNYLIGLERNLDPDLPEHERNTTTVVLLKDREFGNVGKFHIYFNRDTGQLKEIF